MKLKNNKLLEEPGTKMANLSARRPSDSHISPVSLMQQVLHLVPLLLVFAL